MPAPTSMTEFVDVVRRSGLLDETRLSKYLNAKEVPEEPRKAATQLAKDGLLTVFQAKQLLAGRHRGFFLGPYKILDQLGKGGMGAVFLCEHTTMGRKVAVKVLPAAHAENSAAVQRFHREARAVAALDHPNIVKAYDIGREGKNHFLVMEYVEGRNLDDMVRQNGAIPYEEAVGYVVQAAAGLQHAHERGLIHRDIKPANLLVTADGVVKLLDMGLARFFRDTKDNLTDRLNDNVILGTVDYAAPEQALSNKVDLRADVYSLGATLYALIKGEPPFAGSTSQKLLAHQMREAPSLHLVRTDVPEGLSDVVATMMAKNAEDRYQSAAEAIDALVPWVPPIATSGGGSASNSTQVLSGLTKVGSGGTAKRVRRSPAKRAKARRNLIVVGAFVGMLALGAVAVLLYAYFGKTGPSDPSGGQVRYIPPPQPGQAGNQVVNPGAPKQPTPPKPGVDPNTPAKWVPLYKMEIRPTEPFKLAVHGTQVTPSEHPIPSDWVPNAWKPDTVGEITGEVVNGRFAVGMYNLDGPESLQFYTTFQVPTTAGRHYKLRVEYLTRGTAQAYVQWKRAEDYPSWLDHRLPPTDGEWKVHEFEGEALKDTNFALAVQNRTFGRENAFYLRSFELLENQGGSGAEAAAPAPGAPTAAREVFKFVAATAAPFTVKMKQYEILTRTGTIPAPWRVDLWQAGSVGEVALESTADGQGVVLRNLEGTPSVQFWSGDALTKTTPGKKYAVRFEYRVDGNGKGLADVRYAHNSRASLSAQLNPTNGRWEEVVIEVDEERSVPLYVFVQNHSAGAANAVWVRAVEITELAAK